jgi:hypothetical protein
MSGNKAIHKSPKANTNGFDKNPQNINRKGNRKLVSGVIAELEEKGVLETSIQEIKGVYLRLVNLTIKEIQEEVSNEESPALVRIVGKEVLSGKGFEIIEKMLDRAIGKPQQHIDHTSDGEKITLRDVE